jgi:phosphopantothenate-cysteine ligase
MEKTPKIISFLRGLAPQAVIVGFKLLDGVSETELLDAAAGVLEKNECDFVLANDARGITADGHSAILLRRGREIAGRFATKAEIADGIAAAVLQILAERVQL